MLDSKLYNGCNHPSYLVNKSTGAVIYTECGKCAYCLSKRARKSSMRVQYNARKYKYCYFVTLDFAPEHLPLLHCSVVDKEYGCECIDGHIFDDYKCNIVPFSQWHGATNEYVTILLRQVQGSVPYNKDKRCYEPVQDTIRLTPEQLKALMLRTRPTSGEPLPIDTLPFANYVEVQNFFKRLKVNLKRLNSKCDAKLSYYVVTEYGPRTLRPHVHLLLFFDSDITRTYIQQACRKSWRLGSVDCSLSSGKSINYVAGYINSNASLPDVYLSSKVFKTRSRASVGFDLLDKIPVPSDSDAVQEFNARLLDGEISASNGKTCTFRPAPKVVATLYPRFAAYDGDDAVQTARILYAYATASKRLAYDCSTWNTESIFKFSRYLYGYLKAEFKESIMQSYCNAYDIDLALAANLVNKSGFIYSRYDLEELGVKSCDDMYDIDEFLCMRLYRLCLVCANFFKAWHNYDFTFCELVRFLRDFYEQEDKRRYLQLADYFLRLERDYYPDLVPYAAISRYKSKGSVITPDSTRFVELPFMKALANGNKLILESKIKHKKINDSLGIWLRSNNLK